MKIFISYRREDSQEVAGRIYDRLVKRFGRKSVFKDVDNIPAGVDFRDYVLEVIRQCDTQLVLISSNWLNILDSTGQRRLEDPLDLVRIEIETALAQGLRVVPVLLGETSMPHMDELPLTLVALATINATRVRPDPDFNHDVQRLIRSLGQKRPLIMEITEERRRKSFWTIGRRQHLITSSFVAAIGSIALVSVVIYSLTVSPALAHLNLFPNFLACSTSTPTYPTPVPSPTIQPIPALSVTPIQLKLAVDYRGLLADDSGVIAHTQEQILAQPSLTGRQAAIVLVLSGSGDNDVSGALQISKKMAQLLSALGQEGKIFVHTAYKEYFMVGSTLGTVELDIYLYSKALGNVSYSAPLFLSHGSLCLANSTPGRRVASPTAPLPSPTISTQCPRSGSMDLVPDVISLMIDYHKLLGNDPSIRSGVQSQVKADPRLANRCAALVLVHGGSSGIDPDTAQTIALKVVAILSSIARDGGVFEGSNFRILSPQPLDAPDSIELELYLLR